MPRGIYDRTKAKKNAGAAKGIRKKKSWGRKAAGPSVEDMVQDLITRYGTEGSRIWLREFDDYMSRKR